MVPKSQNSTDPSGPQRAELDRVVDTLSTISSDLLESYHALKAKADRVENELQRANEELEERVSELQAILQALPTGVIVRDETGSVAHVNGAAREMLGTGEADLPTFAESSPASNSHEWSRPDGTRVVLSTRRSEMRTPSGKVFGSVEILDDQTELTRLTERVHRMDKMAALGTMAAGIAHEIRNPMNAIKGFSDLLERQDFEAREKRWARNISAGVNEVETIIHSMLTFADPEPLRLETVDAEELVQSAIAAATDHLGESDAWTIDSHCYALEFVGDRIKLRQALRNLISNSIDSQPDGGRILVELFLEGEVVCCAVSDAGPGISPEVLPRLSDPFFTTRAEGTGLGLTLVHTIAQLHGGRLHATSDPSSLGGARLSIRIPFVPCP